MKQKKCNKKTILSLILSVSVLANILSLNVSAEEDVVHKLQTITSEKAETKGLIDNNISTDEVLLQTETLDIAINNDNFPDNLFQEYIKEHFDTNNDNYLSSNEILVAKKIDLEWNDAITSIQGVEYFTDLEVLYCAGTSISSLDVSKNTMLKELDCSYAGELSILDVSNNKSLKILYCYETSIEELNVENNTALVRIDCNNTKIKKLDVRNNKELFALNCEDTLVDVLNISENPKLYEVYITNTPIKAMDYTNNPELVHIRVSGTKMTTLDVSKNLKLAALYLNDTRITELDLSNNLALFEIFCYDSDIKQLDLSNFANLHTLECYNTYLSELNISNNINLVGLNCSNTNITTLDLSKNTLLQRLEFERTLIQNIDLSNNTVLRFLNASNTDLSKINTSHLSNLEELYCKNTKIKALDLSNSTQLCSIDCSESQLTELNLSTVSELWNEKNISPQKRTVYSKTHGNSIIFDLKSIVSDLSKVTLIDGDGYTYDKISGIITLTNPEVTTLSYLYDSGYVYDDITPMEVTLNIQKGYEMLQGKDQVLEEETDAIFKSAANFNTFVKVLIDEVEITSNNYIASEGSIIITLKKEFIKTLSEGIHTINIVSNDGIAEANFTIVRRLVGENIVDNDTKSVSIQNASINNVSPKTEDKNTTMFWLCLFILAFGYMTFSRKCKQ